DEQRRESRGGHRAGGGAIAGVVPAAAGELCIDVGVFEFLPVTLFDFQAALGGFPQGQCPELPDRIVLARSPRVLIIIPSSSALAESIEQPLRVRRELVAKLGWQL